jgi:hypothetical protein
MNTRLSFRGLSICLAPLTRPLLPALCRCSILGRAVPSPTFRFGVKACAVQSLALPSPSPLHPSAAQLRCASNRYTTSYPYLRISHEWNGRSACGRQRAEESMWLMLFLQQCQRLLHQPVPSLPSKYVKLSPESAAENGVYAQEDKYPLLQRNASLRLAPRFPCLIPNTHEVCVHMDTCTQPTNCWQNPEIQSQPRL